MFVVPFGRIFWKEYRVHRALWFSCLAIGCLMQLLMWCFLVRSPNQTVEVFQVFVVIIPLMYAVGCGALLFAGEREDRTSEWLVNLAAPPAPTLFAKFAFGISSTVALQLAMEIVSRLVLVGTPDSSGSHRIFYPMPYGPVILAWTILGSLRSRQVMKSFLTMLLFVFLSSACMPILMLGFRFFFGTPLDPLVMFLFASVTILLVVIAADIGLGWRWCEGRYFDGVTLGALFERDDRFADVLPGKTKTSSRVPVRTEYEQPWRRTWERLVWQERHRASMIWVLIVCCLAGAATGSIPSESGSINSINHLGIQGLISLIAFGVGLAGFRSDAQFQQPRFLVSRGISPAAVWLAKHFVWFPRACCLAAVTLIAATASYAMGDFPEVVLLAILIPIVFALASLFFSRIPLGETLSGWVDSISSSGLAKQAALTSRACWILGLVYFFSNWFDWMSSGQFDHRSWRFHTSAALAMIMLGLRFDTNLIFAASHRTPRILSHFPSLSRWLPTIFWCLAACWLAFMAISEFEPTLNVTSRASIRLSAGIRFDWEILCWCLLLSYCCGQLAAILFQRVTLALVAGLVLTCSSFVWLSLVQVMAIPQWWSLGLVVLAMLGLTLWQLRPWLLANRSWSRRWRLASVLVAVPALLVALLAYYRVAEASLPLAIDQTLGRHFYSPNLPRHEAAGNDSIRRRLETLSHVDEADSQGAVEEIIDLLKRNSVVFVRDNREEDPTFTTASRIRNLLSHQADAYLQGEIPQGVSLEKALECHRANLQLARSVSQGPFYAWLNGSLIQAATLEKLVEWANHPSQTAASIRAGIKLIESDVKQFPSATTGIADSYWSDRRRWILSSREEVIEAVSQLSSSTRDSLGLQTLPIILPWERERADLLLARNAQVQLAAVWSLEHRLHSSNGSVRRTIENEFGSIVAANEKLNRTTPLVQILGLPFHRIIDSVLRHEATARAAITRMELIAYRLEHGKLPDRLIQLMETLDGKYLIDPWSDRLFDFYPAFLLSAGSAHSALVPVSSTEVEIVHDSNSDTSGRVNFQDVLTETRQAVVIRPAGGTSMALNRDGVTSSCLFTIPSPAIK